MSSLYLETEEGAQAAVFEWAKCYERLYPCLRLMYHVPNEGKRTKATGARLCRIGMRRGVPDICLPHPSGVYHGLYIELKAERGKPTVEQREYLTALESEGYFVALCYGSHAAIDSIKRYLGISEVSG